MANWIPPTITSSTLISLSHISQLRSVIDGDRGAVGLQPFAWTDNPLTTSTHIRAVHTGQIRTAVQELWFIKRLGSLPTWSVGTPPTPSRQISARDITDLRHWVDTYEASPAVADPQGIVSFTYDSGVPAIVSSGFCQDVVSLKPSGDRLLIRSRVIANADNTLPLSQLNQAIATWSAVGVTSVGGILTSDTVRTSDGCPNDVLGYGGDPLLNQYIANFAYGASLLAQNVPSMKTFWIWNEPNVQNVINPGDNCPQLTSALSPQVFGAMLYKTATTLKAAGATTVYTGSLALGYPQDSRIGNGVQFLTAMYQYLNANGVVAPYPWDAISLNIEGYPNTTYIGTIFDTLIPVMVAANDYSPFVIGEWGTANSVYNFASAQATYNALRSLFATMYFYVHPVDPANDYGTTTYSPVGGQFVPTGTLPWYAGLQTLYQSP